MCGFCKDYSVHEILVLIDKANQYKLEGLDLLDHYGVNELVHIYNGVGPDRFPEKIRGFMTKCNKVALPAVLLHDAGYEWGGNHDDFHRVNRQLLHNLRTIAKAEYSMCNPIRWIQWIRSWYFYKACEEIGWEGFHKR